MTRAGVIFLAGLLLTGCGAGPVAPKKVSGTGKDESKRTVKDVG